LSVRWRMAVRQRAERRRTDMADTPVTLELDELLLRPWQADDLDRLHAVGQDAEVARWVYLPQPFRIEDATAYLEAAMVLWQDGTGASFVIADRSRDPLGAVTRFGPEGHA